MVADGSVAVQVRYINSEWRDRKTGPSIGSRETRRANTSYRPVEIHDARPSDAAGELGLDVNGFILLAHRTRCPDFTDEGVIRETYLPEMLEQVRRATGADAAYHYSYLIRTETPVDFNNGYARFVHCDYNAKRIEELSHDVLRRHGAEPHAGQSYAWYNTWQPFDFPAIRNPLAFIDARTLADGDVIDYRYTGPGRDNIVAAPVYNEQHRWCYFPEMTTGEMVILKQMDQRPGRVVYCPHTSFDHPAVPDDAPPRRSIETRVVAVFED